MNKVLFEGCATALITPFRNGQIDFDAYAKIIEFQIKAGVKALVVLGTTGEPCTLTAEERTKLIKFAKKTIKNRAMLIVGTGSNDTREAVKRSVEAKNLGADGLLVVTPYYNKCTQKGLVKYFNEIADTVKLPIIAYNVPSRTGLNMSPATAAEISNNPYIVGLKAATENLANVCRFANTLDDKMALYSGDDEANLIYSALGAHGYISVAANAIPKKIVALYEYFKTGDLEKALELHNEIYEFCGALFCEVNPIPVKAIMHHLRLCTDEMRSPLTTIESANREKLVSIYNKIVQPN